LFLLFVEHIDDNADEWAIDAENEKEELPEGDGVWRYCIERVDSKVKRYTRNDIEYEKDEKYENG